MGVVWGVAYQIGQALRHGADFALCVPQVSAVAEALARVMAEVVHEELEVAGVSQGPLIVLSQPFQKLRKGKET
jgi:hypothetical protein